MSTLSKTISLPLPTGERCLLIIHFQVLFLVFREDISWLNSQILEPLSRSGGITHASSLLPGGNAFLNFENTGPPKRWWKFIVKKKQKEKNTKKRMLWCLVQVRPNLGIQKNANLEIWGHRNLGTIPRVSWGLCLWWKFSVLCLLVKSWKKYVMSLSWQKKANDRSTTKPGWRVQC